MDPEIRRTIIAIAVLVFILAGIFFLMNALGDRTPGNEGSTTTPRAAEDSLGEYFQERLIALGTADIGQPIEGFDPNLLMAAFPGLVPSDFDGVRALEGSFVVSSAGIEFVRDASSPVSSAERMIVKEGYARLLQNVSARHGTTATTAAGVDALIARIDTGERVTARIGEKVSALDVAITPLQVLEDSRCPADVECIQAGTVRVRAKLESGLGTAMQVFTLGQPVTTEAEEVRLVQVSPNPVAGTAIPSADYRFTFEIKKRNL